MKFLGKHLDPFFKDLPDFTEGGIGYYKSATGELYYYNAVAAQWELIATGTGTQEVFIQDTAPVSPPSDYIWIQTGLGLTGDDWTLWFNE